MDFYATIFEVIDMRSFSNLWYWIALAVLWSTASHFVLGVPYDLALKAKRRGGDAMDDLELLVKINVGRLLNVAEVSGLMLTALGTGLITALAITGFVYDVEFSQALFLMAFPMSIVFFLNVRTAQKIKVAEPSGEALIALMRRHRTHTQIVGVFAIFVTALWGMYQNIVTGPLGG